MKRTLALLFASAALVVACTRSAPSTGPDIVTTAPPAPPTASGPPLSLPPATFPDRSALPSNAASLPPLVQPGNSPIGSP